MLGKSVLRKPTMRLGLLLAVTFLGECTCTDPYFWSILRQYGAGKGLASESGAIMVTKQATGSAVSAVGIFLRGGMS